MKKRLAVRLTIGLLVALALGLLTWFVFIPHWAEIQPIFSSQEALRAYLQRFGYWSPAIFFLFQVAQIVFSPIPGNVTTLAGGFIFGIGPGFLLSGAGMLVGSVIAFLLARFLGQKIVIRLIGQKQFERYNRLFAGKLGLSLIILFLLPFSPDDVLCLLAGLSALPLSIFLLFLLLGRLPGVFLTTLVGAGVLAFSLWQWIVIGVFSLIVLIVYIKYGDALGEWIQQKIKH